MTHSAFNGCLNNIFQDSNNLPIISCSYYIAMGVECKLLISTFIPKKQNLLKAFTLFGSDICKLQKE